MNKKEHKLSPAELYNHEFEDLSKDIVRFLFQGTDAQLTKTRTQKDGGYDIVVECSNNNVYQKVYFECKLRSGNLNLRDIAANIIIAYNEGAVALVAITNYNYTEQASENIKDFYQKTTLNIKVIIGDDIRSIVSKGNIVISPNLKKLITPKKSYRKNSYDFLKINLESAKPYEKIMQKGINLAKNSKTFVAEHYDNEICKMQRFLERGDLVCVEGYIGIGKTSIINFCLQKISAHTIRITADNYLSQSELLLSIFLDLWGIPMHTIVGLFSKENIERIVAVVNEKSASEHTGEIIEKLLVKNTSEGIADEYYNYRICQYLIYNLKIHFGSIFYVFFIENVSKASDEIQKLLIYICKLLKKNRIACIIEKDIVEYQWQDYDMSFFNKIDYQTVPIALWTNDDARDFIDCELKEYPKGFREAVLSRGGTRLQTLSLIIDFCREKSKNSGKINEADLQQFEPNEIPSSIRCLLNMYFEKVPKLFCYFYFANGKIPIKWSLELLEPYQECIEHLLNMDFLGMDDTYIWIKGELVLEYIQRLVRTRRLLQHNMASKILSFLQTQEPNEHVESFIYIYDSLEKYGRILPLLDNYMHKLYKERQYHSFLKWADFLFERKEKLGLTLPMQLDLTIHTLIVWRIKREINGEEAAYRMQEMHDLISKCTIENKAYYQMVLDCFYAESFFQDCDFQKALECSQTYYQKTLTQNIIDSNYEWQEKICVIYALCIKEQMGNEKALDVFKKLITAFPQSFFVQMEYWDHLECINIYKDPKYALECVNNVLDKFKDTPRYDYPLPFHEYVDRSMCALCAKEYDLAMEYSDNSIDVLESNGILSTLGRAYNIRGCIFLCKNDLDNAKEYFKESKYLLDRSKEYLYSWRSSLNLITLELTYKTTDFSMQDIKAMLNETYSQFKGIYQEKMENLITEDIFYTSREYFALLMFNHAFKLCNCRKSVLDDFDLKDKCEMFLRHFKQLQDKRVKTAEFSDCAYAVGKYIFMVG